MTAIIIPVYKAANVLRRCLDSVIQYTSDSVPVLLINDASDDPAVDQVIASALALRPGWQLIEHTLNQGFVKTVNEGMAQLDTDVILLNSDTVVSEGWIDGLQRCARSDAQIATVTPFSNNAEICSYPLFCQVNPMPEKVSVVAAAVRRTGSRQYPDLPTGVGFCMFIRRRALDELGLFDAETYGAGYGEENDFCMRASMAGWRNVLCDDTFVAHQGGQSFAQTEHQPGGENLKKLIQRYPDYEQRVAEFIQTDPIRPIREAIDLEIASSLSLQEASDMNQSLPFTGERFTPECVREIWYEHMHRYAIVGRLLAGKTVLDIACGEGYGSSLLARSAKRVIAMDISDEAVQHATARYGSQSRLQFRHGDATAIDLPADSVDVVVSFETIEHLSDHASMMCEFDRVLRPDGFVIISSPDKATYSDAVGYRNEFHVRELYREEFESTVGVHFTHQRLYAQKLGFISSLYALDQSHQTDFNTASWQVIDEDGSTAGPAELDPLYFVMLAARQASHLPEGLSELMLFQDRSESVYAHYQHEIRINMQSGARLIELEASNERLQQQLQRVPRWLRRLLKLSS